MNKLYILIILCFITFSGALSKEHHTSSCLKNKEESLTDVAAFPLKPNQTIQEVIFSDLKASSPDRDSFEQPHDVLSLLTSERMTTLQKMKELRKWAKKEGNPHSEWKLLQVDNDEDILFQAHSLALGGFQESFSISRLMKIKENFLLITIEEEGDLPSKEEQQRWISYLLSLEY